MEIITDYTQINNKDWYNFVRNHPNGNIFHTPDMVEVYAKTKNYSPITTIATENQKIIGVLVGVIQKEAKGVLGNLSSRCIVFGGPLIINKNTKTLVNLLKYHNKQIKNKAIYTQIRNIFDIKYAKEEFKKAGFKYTPHLDIHIDLKQDPENYWNSLKSKLRQKIRKAYKNDIIFKEIEADKEIDEAYSILYDVYNRAKLPLPDLSLFHNAYKILNNSNKKQLICFKAEKQKEIIGVRFILLFNDTIYDWYAGSKLAHYKYNPNDFLPYKIIEWGMRSNEYSLFKFGGAGKPNIPYGVRDHKLKFSNNLIELGRFEKIHQPIVFNIAKTGFRIWQKIKYKK